MCRAGRCRCVDARGDREHGTGVFVPRHQRSARKERDERTNVAADKFLSTGGCVLDPYRGRSASGIPTCECNNRITGTLRSGNGSVMTAIESAAEIFGIRFPSMKSMPPPRKFNSRRPAADSGRPGGGPSAPKGYYDVKGGRSPEFDVVALYQNPCKCWSLGLYYLVPGPTGYSFMFSMTGIGWTENFRYDCGQDHPRSVAGRRSWVALGRARWSLWSCTKCAPCSVDANGALLVKRRLDFRLSGASAAMIETKRAAGVRLNRRTVLTTCLLMLAIAVQEIYPPGLSATEHMTHLERAAVFEGGRLSTSAGGVSGRSEG